MSEEKLPGHVPLINRTISVKIKSGLIGQQRVHEKFLKFSIFCWFLSLKAFSGHPRL